MDVERATTSILQFLVINNKFNQVSNVISSNDRMISTLLFCLFSINFPKTRYLQQVLNESMRLSALIPWAAKVQDLDIELGGHIIPKGVSVTSRSKNS